MPKFTPFLWFDGKSEEAAKFCVSIFGNSRIVSVARYGEAGAQASGRRKGSVMTVEFELDGHKFVGLNGGPQFTFSPAISFVVNCDTQAEVDRFRERLSRGGEEMACGWLKDKYGVAWQIAPATIFEMLTDPDPAKSERVLQALLEMKKLDLAALAKAYSGEQAGGGREPRAKRAAG